VRSVWYAPVKRCGDLVLGVVALAALAPVVAVVAVVVRCALGRPVLFRQTRLGYRGAEFELVKFRTMTPGSGDPASDERRLTAVGRWLRATSLDELPSLWNVVRGQMSLVGPRPLLPRYRERYTARQARRHEVRPGLTGLAQVRGRNALSWDDRLEYDVSYVDNMGLRLDLVILLRTVGCVLRRDGVSAAGSATMPEFMGRASDV
jgi:lipopolysaccharide/colanic/teichoic acid biosynthesis glycosyltransferase